jgi:uncharacterized protein DUF4255
MSNAKAIATVTTALAQIVRDAARSEVNGAEVVTGRPDQQGTPSQRIHLFLYQVSSCAALRNSDLPARAPDGKLLQRPFVALDLHYMLSFYGDENALETQRMLGAVVRDLHAKPVLRRQMIKDAVASQAFLNGSNLADAFEQVKFTPLPMSLEEVSKLWSVFFQIPYALSVAYEATVVLIESEEAAQPALPVLRRGQDDRGVDTLLGPFPAIESIDIGAPEDAGRIPRAPSYPSARLGDMLIINGRNLGGEEVIVRFAHPRLPEAVEITIPQPDRTGTEARITIPDDTAAETEWVAGLYSVSILVRSGSTERSTNAFPLSFAPKIKSIAPNPAARNGDGNVTLTVTFAPQVQINQNDDLPDDEKVQFNQRVALFLAGGEYPATRPDPADPPLTATGELDFEIEKAPVVTESVVRLRVDGVDSLPFKREGSPPRLVFDDEQKVTIT